LWQLLFSQRSWRQETAGEIDGEAIRRRWDAVGSKLDERGRRFFAAGEVRALGRGGLAAVSSIAGLARSTIERGLKDLDAPVLPRGPARREGGGRRPLSASDPALSIRCGRCYGDKLASALAEMGHTISPNSVRKLLTGLGFSRQSNRKADEGAHHPDRNAQFEHKRKLPVSRSYLSIPRRRSWLAISEMAAAITGPRADRSV
jgi:hypothetical protein